MKIEFLGTGSSEGFPALFCECEHCTRAKAAGGRNLRSRSQAVIDDTVLIDFPPDTYAHVLYGGLELSKIHSLLITHRHGDHLFERDLACRGKPQAYLNDDTPLVIFGTQPTLERLSWLGEKQKIVTSLITPFLSFETERYTVTPLAANHDKSTDPVIFLITKGGKTLLYAHDTGGFPDKTWEWLETNRPQIDLVSYDCNDGEKTQWKGHHMGFDEVREMSRRLHAAGVIKDNTIQVLNHFSHNGYVTYDDLSPLAKEAGFIVSFDGLKVEF